MSQLVNIIPVELTDIRSATTTNGGNALTATATGAGTPLALGFVSIPFGSDYMSITPLNFSGCSAVGVTLNPYLTIFYTTDAGVTVTDISEEMQDGDAVDVAIDDFPATGTGWVYVGSPVPFRGVAIGIGSPNGTTNNLTVKYWDGGAWADIVDTDSTDTGASLAVDGTVVWTVPSAWSKETIDNIGDTLPVQAVSFVPSRATPLYWTRWEWSDVMDSDTDLRQMLALNKSDAYAGLLEGQNLEIRVSDRRIANVQAITDAGTAKLLVNVGTLPGSEFE